MEDLRSILAHYNGRKRRKKVSSDEHPKKVEATFSEIPDIFFEEVLVKTKLTRIEIMVLLYLYRQVWCRPNLYKVYGFSQLLSYTEMANKLSISLDDVYQALRKLEELNLIETIRSGQYFVRKYFTSDLDNQYQHSYDDF